MFNKEILYLIENNLYRFIKDRESPQGSKIRIKGKELINFGSNDYLGFSNHPEVVEAAIEALHKYGFGSGASRLLSGGSIIHRRLEERIASFKDAEDSILFNSGYAANTGVIPAITNMDDLILSDELNHASIIDGCKLSKAKKILYRHRDIGHIKEIISKETAEIKGKVVIVTDSVFSMDGDIAPIKDIYNLCSELNSSKKGRAILYIDDAHGTGVIGGGKGVLAHFGLKNERWIIQMGTFSKALGSFGAFVAGTADIIDWLRNTSRSFIFTTALPAPVVASSLRALEILEKNYEPVKKLWTNRERFLAGLSEIGFDVTKSETPIIPLFMGDTHKVLSLSRSLEEKGIYVPAIRPPTVKVPRLRITVTASHTEGEICQLLEELNDSCRLTN